MPVATAAVLRVVTDPKLLESAQAGFVPFKCFLPLTELGFLLHRDRMCWSNWASCNLSAWAGCIQELKLSPNALPLQVSVFFPLLCSHAASGGVQSFIPHS